MLGEKPKYEQYQSVGLPWLVEVPAEWDVKPFAGLFEMSREKNGKSIVGSMLSVSGYRGIEQKRYENETQVREDKDLADYRVVRPNQLVVNTMWLNHTGLGVSELEGHVSPAYRSYNIDQSLVPRYAHYLLRSHNYVQGYTGLMQGIRPNSLQIKDVDFKRMPVLVPDLDTQNRIVSFLDEKTAEIDAAMDKKRRLIGLLNEQKAILINRAVTKGLNPDAPMKDSGVDWIGEIPAHWEVKRFKHCVKTQSGQVDPTKQPYKEMILIAPNHIVQGTGETLDFETADEQGADSGKYFAEAGSVIYSKIRPNLNKACIVDFDALCSADMYALRGYPKYFEQRYLLRQILSDCFVIPAVDASMRVAMPKVNREAMAEFPMIIPPKSEQSEIIEWLDARLAEVRAPQVATEREISTLNEFKQTLIANAVTGKIKI